MEAEVRLSRGQKKKLRQRQRQVPEAEGGWDSPMAPPGAPASSSSGTPSEFSSSGSEGEDAEATRRAGAGAAAAGRGAWVEAAGAGAAGPPASADALGAGWPSPAGARPPGWPPCGAELLSRHGAGSLPPQAQGQALRLSALPCPQPLDPLSWRLLPLVRGALAQSDEALSASEITRLVSGSLPAACLATVSASRLHSLVALLLARNVQRGRLLHRGGKRYALPSRDDPAVAIPQLDCARLDSLWVAWGIEAKCPHEAALQLQCSGASGMPAGSTLWLFARPRRRPKWLERASNAPGAPAEVLRLGDREVRARAAGGRHAARYDWWDEAGRTWWELAVPGGLGPEAALELVAQVVASCGAARAPPRGPGSEESGEAEEGGEAEEEDEVIDGAR